MASQVHDRSQETDEHGAFLELPRKLTHMGRAAPRMDAHEFDGTIELTAEVPGVPESAIELSLDGNILTIAVDKRDLNEGRQLHFSERSFGRFKRSIQLPFAPDPEKVEAVLADGLLSVRFPRVDAQRSRPIAVRRARSEQSERSAIGSDWSDKPAPAEDPLTLTVKARPMTPPPTRNG
jgi:HSP20 family protein